MKISGSDLHLFRVFDSVVRNKGISAAQAELSLSQPTISNHLTALEERLGITLCERGRRGFVLTEKGRTVHEIGMEIIRSLDMQSHRLTSLNGGMTGQVRLGIVDCVASDLNCRIFEVVASLAQKAPTVEILLHIMRPSDIIAGIANGELDIGIGSFDTRISSLDYDLLYEEENALYCGLNDPLFVQPTGSIAKIDCYQRPWVHRGYWSSRRQYCFERIEADRIIYDIEAQLMMILSGAYIGLLPVHYAQRFEHDGRLRRLPMYEDDYKAKIEIVMRAGKTARSTAFVRRIIYQHHEKHLIKSI